MTLFYADTSALVRAYFSEEADHQALRSSLREGSDPVVPSELARLEFPAPLRGGPRWPTPASTPHRVLARFDEECRPEGPLALLELDPRRVFPEAQRLLATYAFRSLDAIHLAVALVDAVGLAGGAGLAFVSRDGAQRAAAEGEGLTVL